MASEKCAFSMKKALAAELDKRRGDIPRGTFVRAILESVFAGGEAIEQRPQEPQKLSRAQRSMRAEFGKGRG